jgi:hypothetical protein
MNEAVELACYRACKGGDVEKLTELRGNIDVHVDYEYVLEHAARFGRVGVMQWLYDDASGDELFRSQADKVWRVAASHGHVELMQWLQESSVQWTVNPLGSAVYAKKVAAVEWMLRNNIAIDRRAMLCAAEARDTAIGKILVDNGGELFFDLVVHALDNFMRDCDEGDDDEGFKFAKWLLSVGCPIEKVAFAEQARALGDHAPVKWARENVCPYVY